MFWRQQNSNRRWKLVLVSHTHWDREWYLPFQLFRAKLVGAVDNLIDLMEARPDFRFFTLDGQTILLEDYLEVRPEREAELIRLVREGRVLIGPWYILPDEFLVSGESLVRNLLEGRRASRRYGPVMSVGYLPDPFGHIAQMPQILRGFGIDSAVLWRGTGGRVAKNETIWQGLDGSEVLLEQTPGGYDNAALLPSDRDALMERLSHIRAELEPRATTDYLLLMNGDDHMLPQPDIPSVIAEANGRLRDAQIVHGTLPMLMDGVREQASTNGVEWDRVSGEFRSSELAHLLAGVLSARMTLKLRNTACQDLLERWAEPFSVYASLVARPSQGRKEDDSPSLLRMAWRYLLMNQPHDSISGCSVDQVHDEMSSRYDWCEQIGGLVADRALDALAGLADTESLLQGSDGQGAIVVFNSESGPRTDYVSSTVDLPGGAENVALVGPNGEEVPFQVLREHRFELASSTLTRSEVQGYLRLSGPGRSWPHWKLRILDKIVRAALRDKAPDLVVAGMDVVPGDDPATVEVEVEARSGREHNWDALSEGMRQLSNLVDRGDAQFFRVRVNRRDQVDVAFIAPDVPEHGMKLFHFRPSTRKPGLQVHGHEDIILENQFFSIQISREDGAARLVDRETGAIYWGINCFVDSGDAGDEYTYSPPPIDRTVEGPDGRPSIVMEESGSIRQTVRVELGLRLPVGLTADRRARSEETVVCPVTSQLTVYPGVPRVDVRTTVVNHARDHRIRVAFPTHLNAHFSNAEGQFAVIQRSIDPEAGSGDWLESPVPTQPQLCFVDISDGESGLMIANRGLPEYEVARGERGTDVWITLLRSVGWLSRDDLTTRQGAAGPLLETPGAQMLGPHTFEYSIIPHAGGWENAYQHARWFARPLRARWTQRHSGSIAPEAGFIRLQPSSLLLSAVKKADDGGDVIIRVFNTASETIAGRLHLLFPVMHAATANLAEQPLMDLPVEQARTVRFTARGHEIVTIRLNA